jgi:hypothetical protein
MDIFVLKKLLGARDHRRPVRFFHLLVLFAGSLGLDSYAEPNRKTMSGNASSLPIRRRLQFAAVAAFTVIALFVAMRPATGQEASPRVISITSSSPDALQLHVSGRPGGDSPDAGGAP